MAFWDKLKELIKVDADLRKLFNIEIKPTVINITINANAPPIQQITEGNRTILLRRKPISLR